jgi:hypothetical protein
MKNLILILLVFGFNTFGYSYNDNDISYKSDISTDNPAFITSSVKNDNLENCVLGTINTAPEKSEVLKECTVRLNMTLENGTKIEGTVTFSDVSWLECATMQLGAWWDRNF